MPGLDQLWQHEDTGRFVWSADRPGPRWALVDTMFEDELPNTMSVELYDFWYSNSHVPDGVGCRIGPKLYYELSEGENE